MSIADYGWTSARGPLPAALEPARVLRAAGHSVSLISETGTFETVSLTPLLPGDWVTFDPTAHVVVERLPRSGLLSRKRPGRATIEQPIAANVDVALIVQGLDGDYNPRRLERYLLLAAACSVRAAIVLNKADLLPTAEAELLARQISARTSASVALISATSGTGLSQLHELVKPCETAVLLGSSGAGKSTLTNALLGRNLQPTNEVRAGDSRGRHTTTARELFLLPSGWLLIDTPGLREVGAWAADGALDDVFSDISSLASQCRFSDCRHQTEPGCAVREAEASGELDTERLEHFTRLSHETTEQESKRQARIMQRAIRQFWKIRGRK